MPEQGLLVFLQPGFAGRVFFQGKVFVPGLQLVISKFAHNQPAVPPVPVRVITHKQARFTCREQGSELVEANRPAVCVRARAIHKCEHIQRFFWVEEYPGAVLEADIVFQEPFYCLRVLCPHFIAVGDQVHHKSIRTPFKKAAIAGFQRCEPLPLTRLFFWPAMNFPANSQGTS